jgi:hypothetical protein
MCGAPALPSVVDTSTNWREGTMTGDHEGWRDDTGARPVTRPYHYSIGHHPRVFRLDAEEGWCWACGCGSSGHSTPAPGQRAATLAAVAHVHSRPAAR